MTRPNMRFVPIKSIEQQSILSIHKARESPVSMNGQANQLRGLLAEFGIVLPKGSASLNKQIPLILEDAENNLTSSARSLVAQLKELMILLYKLVS